MKSLWGGRFSGTADEYFDAFNRSFPFDQRLFEADVKGSLAYAAGLHRAGILDDEEYQSLVKGLNELLHKAEQNPGWVAAGVAEGFEDVHAFVESRLGDLVGDAARKLHTGRSRNDQVATDMRLFLRDAIDHTVARIVALQKTLLERAEEDPEAPLPGYTHLQKAQPVLWSHYLLSFFAMLDRDKARFLDARGRVNIMPLGSGALAGNNHAIDRRAMAADLGFADITENSLDATSDRDFVAEFMSAASLTMVHLTRLSEDLIIYNSNEFGFVTMSDQVSTGSSLMPQKKNPDALELIRGKAGRVFGHQMALLTTMKGLPSCYNKDMQEDKEGFFDCFDTLDGCLTVMETVIRTLGVRFDRMRESTRDGYLNATDLADYLVAKNIPFRRAHHLVGEIVVFALKEGVPLGDLSLEQFRTFAVEVDEDVYEALKLETTVGAKVSYGGTAPVRVREALARARDSLA